MPDFIGPDRFEILCGVEGEMIELDYGDPEIGRTQRIVTITSLYVFNGAVYLDGFCHLRADDRTFRPDRVHFIRELTQSGAYSSFVEWMASYGVKVSVRPISNGEYRYIYHPPRKPRGGKGWPRL